MTKKKKAEALTPDELEAQEGEALPDREVMSILPVTDSALPPLYPHEVVPPPPEE
jgi:hypothetical protein